MKIPDNQLLKYSDNIDSVHTGLPFVCINNINISDQYINLINYNVKKTKNLGSQNKIFNPILKMYFTTYQIFVLGYVLHNIL